MKLLFCLLATWSLSMTSQQSQAADGSSGCGPGWYIMKDKSLLSSALRITTNGALAPLVTLGMTFGTSNCTKHKLVLHEKESLHFITMNYFELKGEIAKGQGEFISAFSETIGCPSNVTPEFKKEMKKNYTTLFNNKKIEPKKVLLEVYKVILKNPKLTQKCSLSLS